MANLFHYKDQLFTVGDTIEVVYKIKEGDKERQQSFKGILIKIKGRDDANRMFTIRKSSRSGIGVERIFPTSSPYIASMKLEKKSVFAKSKLYFIRNLSSQQLRTKLYKNK